MEDEIAIWPPNVQTTYWQLDAVTPGASGNVIRFLGIHFAWEFVIAALVGALLIWFFARTAFNKPSFEPDSYNYNVLKKLAPSDLRGQSQVRRAYGLYAGTMILIYAALTFFGKLIINIFNPVLNTAGLSFDTGSLDFQSPQWPIMISFGMIGLIPLLKPVELLERGIRRMAHRRAGIPVHLHQRSAELQRNLDDLVKDEVGREVPEWVRQTLGDPRVVRRWIEARAQLRLLRNWLTDERVHWPDAAQRQRIGRLERDEIEASGVILDEIASLLAQDFDESPKPSSGTEKLGKDQGLLAHRSNMIAKLKTLSAAMERHRDELIAVLAVYAERDERYDAIEDPALEGLVKSVFVRDPAPPGPEAGLLWVLVPVFLVYFCAVWAGQHPDLGPLPPDSPRVAATFWTAFLETARVAVLFWLPVTVVMSIRATRWEATNRNWERMTPRGWTEKMQRQLALGIGSTLLLSLVGLGLIAILWAALVSRDTARFAFLLRDGIIPFLWAMVTLAGIAVIQTVSVMLVADADKTTRTWRRRWLIGAVSAALVVVWKVAHYVLWLRAGGVSAEAVPTWDLIQFWVLPQDYVNLIVYALVAMASVTVLMPRRSRSAPAGGTFRRAAASTTACFALAAVAAEPADAEGVRVGFRADAEPFSFLIDRNDDERYSGYIADLCYRIFATDAYQVETVPVTAQNRFDKLAAGEIDLLCDPVTLRYSLDDGREDGIFSPIVFVTGVSYLLRQVPAAWPPALLIGYVDGTSSAEVVGIACTSDLFRWSDSSRPIGDEDCKARESSECWIGGGTPSWQKEQYRQRAYRVCKASGHSDLIAWLCEDEHDGEKWSKAYFGDQDIIHGKLEAWLKAGKECPGVYRHQTVYTYEPYALVVSRRPEDVELVAYVQRRIYEIFSNRPEALGLFGAHFPGKQMSVPLANLFLLNGVERPECMQFNQGENCRPIEEPPDPLLGAGLSAGVGAGERIAAE